MEEKTIKKSDTIIVLGAGASCGSELPASFSDGGGGSLRPVSAGDYRHSGGSSAAARRGILTLGG